MYTVPFQNPWHVLQPTMYRMLPTQFAKAFYDTGALRLSSFTEFHKHTDEQRFDGDEGVGYLRHDDHLPDGRATFISATTLYGRNAYVLCGSMSDSADIARDFGTDNRIVIYDTTNFACDISSRIPGFQSGSEGPCIYIRGRMFQASLGDLSQLITDPPPTPAQVSQFLTTRLGPVPYYLKVPRFIPQLEYRLVWLTHYEVNGYLDIEVPHARKYCGPYNPNPYA